LGNLDRTASLDFSGKLSTALLVRSPSKLFEELVPNKKTTHRDAAVTGNATETATEYATRTFLVTAMEALIDENTGHALGDNLFAGNA
jgi:hypothetical protein